jgi:hypothetical protein
MRQEIVELIAEIKGETHPDEPTLERLEHIVLETIDVAGAVVRTLDAENLEADLSALSAELAEVADAVIDKFLGSKPARAAVAKGAVAFVLPSAVQSLAAVSGNVEAFQNEYVLPFFTKIEEFGHRGRVAFGG